MSIVEFLSQPLWQRLGLTLVHFLWQGLAVAVLVGVLVRVFRLKDGNARYTAYLLAFIAMIVCPVLTFTAIDIPISPNTGLVTAAEFAEVVDSSSYTALSAGDILPEAETSSPAIPTLANSIPLGQRISGWLNVSMPWVLVMWMAGVIVLSVRLLMGFVGVYRWRHHLEPLPERLAQRVASLSNGLGMRQFSRVFISPTVLQAMAVGYLRPMVLLPAAMVAQMQPEMLEAVIAHELAHIRRFDLWINLAQRVTETLLFYHPAVWWLSICLRSERELCCDELAVKATGRRLTYATTLESVGRARFTAKQPVLAAGLGQNNKPTLGRVRHILGLAPAQRNCPFWLAGVIAVVFLAALVIPTTLALTNQSDEKLSLKVETADGLPVGWKLDYDDGSRGWRSGMADNLAELRIIPTPANEYDESWKEERIRFEIHSLSGKHVGDFHFLPNTVSDRIVLAPDKYVLSYTRGAVDLQSNCTIPLDSTKFEVDLSGAGMYQLRFTPKLKDSGTVISDKYPPTTCKGKVIDVNGNQLGRIKVAAYEMFFNMAGGLDMRLIGETITKADGAFVFETRPSVKKTKGIDGIVVAEKEGLSVGWADWPLYGEQKVTIMLGKPTKLAGFVVDENGEGIANAEVRSVLFKKKNSEKEKTRWLPGLKHLRWLAVRTDRKGRFEFNNIPDDARSDLIVSAEGFGTVYTHKPENLSTGYEGAEFIAGQTDIRVELTAEGRIEGKVIDSKSGRGVAGVKLAVVPTFSPFFFERFLCISREDGTVSIGGLRSGEYVIRGDFPKLYVSVKSGKKTDVQVEVEKSDVQVEVEKTAGQVVVEGIRANRAKFECGYLAWSSKQITARFADSNRPATELAGQYELWWDGKKIATKYVRDQVYKDPEGRYRVEEQQGGTSYDGGILSRKPDFHSDNWLGPEVTRWRGLGAQDWLIQQNSKHENISKDWSVVDNNGVKVIRAITKNMNETARDYRAYSIRDYDPSKGYGLVNEEWYNPNGSPRLKHTVKMLEVIPGGWFPVETRLTKVKSSKIMS